MRHVYKLSSHNPVTLLLTSDITCLTCTLLVEHALMPISNHFSVKSWAGVYISVSSPAGRTYSQVWFSFSNRWRFNEIWYEAWNHDTNAHGITRTSKPVIKFELYGQLGYCSNYSCHTIRMVQMRSQKARVPWCYTAFCTHKHELLHARCKYDH